MSATIPTDTNAPETQTPANTLQSSSSLSAPQTDVECAKCACCGFTEECTLTYIAKVREKYEGRWICGLCAEAVKDEVLRSEDVQVEEALNRHINFCKKFRSSTPPANPTKLLISAMKQVVLRSLDSPRAMRSTPSSPRRGKEDDRQLVRSGSCFSTLAG